MRPIVLPLPGNEALAASLEGDLGPLTVRRFPDGETYLRFDSPVRGRCVVLACTLDRPDEKLVRVILASATARDLGADRVLLVAPYVPYLRQDERFHPGECVSARVVADLLSTAADRIVTVDPHLHRLPSLPPAFDVVRSAPLISAWIASHVSNPVLIGPDEESRQWVSEVAGLCGAPYFILRKTRLGDREVRIEFPSDASWTGRTPVLVDDIISTGRTMISTVKHLRKLGTRPPVCIGVHAILADSAYADLQSAGADRIVTCNTIRHPSNGIDVAPSIAERLAALTA